MHLLRSNLCLMFILVAACSSCQPNGMPRPDAPLCTPLQADKDHFECTSSIGDHRVPTMEIIGTTLDGYEILEGHIDELEKEIIRLRRRCKRRCN